MCGLSSSYRVTDPPLCSSNIFLVFSICSILTIIALKVSKRVIIYTMYQVIWSQFIQSAKFGLRRQQNEAEHFCLNSKIRLASHTR